MISKWKWVLLQISRKLWVRAGLFCVVAVITALLAGYLSPIIPRALSDTIGSDAVDHILDILASSLLAVTTFSLTVMVAAYGAATSNVTPRATKLLIQDSTTQNVLATFIGSFLYSLVGIVALSTGAYGERGRVVLFVVTVIVIGIIIVTILRWIDHLSHLGRVGETTDRVEKATDDALTGRVENPYLGGRPFRHVDEDLPASASPVHPSAIGYVQHIDISKLSEWGKKHEADVYVAVLPGSYVYPAIPLAWLRYNKVPADTEHTDRILSAFTIGDERSFDQDPRFGFCVLAEIASRALSPAVNDPGTAIDVLGRAVRILSKWSDREEHPDKADVQYRNVWVKPLCLGDMYDDVFSPIARDGASIYEVQIRLQKSLIALSRVGGEEHRREAIDQSARAIKRACLALDLDEEKDSLTALARSLPRA